MKKIIDQQIRIQTKTKKRPKIIEFVGSIFDVRDDWYQIGHGKDKCSIYSIEKMPEFVAGIQKNQKLELFVNDEKICNIKNLEIWSCGWVFEANLQGQVKKEQENKNIVDTTYKTSHQIFCDKWQRFDKGVDLYSVLRSVFQIDPRMFNDFNMISTNAQKEILRFAGKIIHEKIQKL